MFWAKSLENIIIIEQVLQCYSATATESGSGQHTLGFEETIFIQPRLPFCFASSRSKKPVFVNITDDELKRIRVSYWWLTVSNKRFVVRNIFLHVCIDYDLCNQLPNQEWIVKSQFENKLVLLAVSPQAKFKFEIQTIRVSMLRLPLKCQIDE